MNNDDQNEVECLDIKTLLLEENYLYNLLNKPDTPADHPLIPRLQDVKKEVDLRVMVGLVNSESNVYMKLLKVINK